MPATKLDTYVIDGGKTLMFALQGLPVRVGEKIVQPHHNTGEIEYFTITGGRAPQHDGSSGRVWYTQTTKAGKKMHSGEFFPSVLNMKWV
jgi:hypothetical protein